MSDDKTTTKDEAKPEKVVEKTTPVKAGSSNKDKPILVDEDKSIPVDRDKDAKDEAKALTEVKKDSLGLEELPEDIRKKLEKKKQEKTSKEKSKKKKTVKKKKNTRKVTVGKAFIKATYNNTIVTLTDMQGNVIAWGSAGVAGFKGPKKSTPYAAQIITRLAVGKAREEYGLSEVSVFISGVGTGRESAVRALNNNGLSVTSIKDITPVPHNGCRARKPRRV